MMSEIGSHPELDPALDLQSPILRELLRYWEGGKAGKPLPARADIDPLEIGPALLPYILIAEVEYEPKLRFRWRLVGTHITETLGRDVTGAYWDEIYNDKVLASLYLRADWLMQQLRPLRAIGLSPRPGRNAGSSETLYLPLSGDGATVNMIMLGSVYIVAPKREG